VRTARNPGGAVAEESASPAVEPPTERSPAPARVRLSKELLAGLILVAIAAFALFASRDLELGTLRAVGPGALPRALALLVLAGGVGFTIAALIRGGESLGRWPLRGAIFITLALVAFALTIRTVGLSVAGPAVVMVSGAASSETRPLELLVFALVLTAACIGLFRFALGLPIPVLVIPGLVTI
jgi:putative tricarboxylic transport membrane protein